MKPSGPRRRDTRAVTDREGSRVPQEDFDVEVVDFDGEVVVAVRGAIDRVTGTVLWDLLAEAIDEAKPRVVVLSLANVTFVDSTAAGVFVRVFKRLRHEGAELVLWAPTSQARKVLQISGLDRVMTIQSEGSSSTAVIHHRDRTVERGRGGKRFLPPRPFWGNSS